MLTLSCGRARGLVLRCCGAYTLSQVKSRQASLGILIVHLQSNTKMIYDVHSYLFRSFLAQGSSAGGGAAR